MAAITTVTVVPNGHYPSFRAGTEQANTGQTDWLQVPEWAQFAEVFLNLTAVAGTTAVATASFLAVPPGVYVDTDTVQIATGAAIADAASQHRYVIGPGISGIADGTDSTSADAEMRINTILPAILGVTLLLSRADANETYTYTLSARFRR